MCDDFRDLTRLDPVFEGNGEVSRQLDHLIARNQRGDRDDAAVPSRKSGSLPNIAENALLRVFLESGARPFRRPRLRVSDFRGQAPGPELMTLRKTARRRP